MPVLLFLDDHLFTLSDDASWGVGAAPKWGVVFDEDHPSNHSDSHISPAPGFVRFDLSSFIKGIIREETPGTRWDPVARCLIVSKSNGSKFWLRFRSPNDALRYGADLGEVRIRGYTGMTKCFRAFQRTLNPRTRLRLPDPKDLAARLNARAWKPSGNSVRFELAASSPEAQAAAFTLWTELFPFNDIWMETRKPTNKPLSLREFVRLDDVHAERKIFSQKDTVTKQLLHDYIKYKGEMLRSLAMGAGDAVPPDDIFPDDPAMIWRDIEATAGPNCAQAVYYSVIRLLTEFPEIPVGHKAFLCLALGESGFPPFLGDGACLHDVREDPYLDAILRSRWQWPCEPRHADACVDALRTSEAGEQVRLAVTDTLIRLDELSRVPPKDLDQWYAAYVTNAEPRTRRRFLSLLSAQPSGRDFLMERLNAAADPESVRKSVADVLRARAAATLKTKRFDFMPEEDCRKIMKVVGEEENRP